MLKRRLYSAAMPKETTTSESLPKASYFSNKDG